MSIPPLELRQGELRLALRPELGGAIAGLWLGDTEVLRSSEAADLASARASACYPLAPYSNRLGYRRFRWQGQDHTTAPNFDDSPHSLHGVAWLRAWERVSASDDQAELRYAHAADAHWPFAFEARQRFVLTPGSLEVHLSFTNLADQPQPAGLGWHPYFPKRHRSRLHIEISERWESDASGLPTRQVPQPGIDGDVAHLAFDNCFEGWRGPARIRDEKLSLRLTSSLPYLVVYTPDTKPYYCVEPVSHVSNAIHMSNPAAHGLRALAPKTTFDAWMKLEIDKA
ncbi:Aldose epimerase [Rubrivivax sp. A210]|uniref:aldose 1-epimerase n=1 Tax=Rubrivivax sp. A210 TaxID=2772301 RepID=UPI00191AB707|nr:aldose 1-epimerase [Rubrivivax sp. A210]CAD5370161.1 Aldose epimerase [Rubrivivax sp. A210]